MLKVEKLRVEVSGREILHGIDMEIPVGRTHILFGENGSGKTTLLMTLMGLDNYKVAGGRILFQGEDITHAPVYERAKMGIGISFQRPPTIRGLKMREMVSIAGGGRAGEDIDGMAQKLKMTDFLERSVNDGFSGGEIKRSELLQLMAQQPNFVMLDEPESGVDLNSIYLVGQVIRELLQKNLNRTRSNSGLIITHTGLILDYVNADVGYVMHEGQIICSGNPREMLQGIRKHGYKECAICRR